MKIILFLSFLMLSVTASVSVEEVLNITVGLLEGAFHEMKLTHIEKCITDTDTIGYDIYDAVEDFIKGDFESIRDGIAHIGDAVEAIADGLGECKEAVESDIQTLIQMGQIFKNPKELVVKIGEDILLNRKSIKKDIETFKTDFAAQTWEKSGRDLGDALALVLFGKVRGVDVDQTTMESNLYDAYLVLAGYAALHQAGSDQFSELYNSTSVFGEDLMMGINNIFSVKPVSTDDMVLMIRKTGFVMQHAGSQLQAEGLFSSIDLSKSNECMQAITKDQITSDVQTFINSAFDAYNVGQLKSLGYYIGAIGSKYCPLTKNTPAF